MKTPLLLFLSVFILFLGCAEKQPEDASEAAEMKLTSPAFKDMDGIPGRYTCEGADINPPLSFADIPEKAVSLALIMDDPDAPRGIWDHWLLWNIPISQGINEDSVPEGATEGTNTGGDLGYGGPCPPPGKPHRYVYKLYALDSMLDLPEGSDKPALESAMKGHVLAEASLTGLYSR